MDSRGRPDECERIDFNVRSGALSKSLFISNQGKTSLIGSSKLIFPSSTSCIKATEVNSFEIEQILKVFSIFILFSPSDNPKEPAHLFSSLSVITAVRPGNFS